MIWLLLVTTMITHSSGDIVTEHTSVWEFRSELHCIAARETFIKAGDTWYRYAVGRCTAAIKS